MADRPIIFSAPMVQALRDGRKTQTRRILKVQPPDAPEPKCAPMNTPRHDAPYLDAYCGEPRTPQNPRGMSRVWHWWQVDDRPGPPVTVTPYAPGDRLWVREAWAPNEVGPGEPIYRADYGQANGVQAYNLRNGSCEVAVSRWRPSINMPRWASRLTLTVTEVRVQRLQEISESDALAEGAGYEMNDLGFSPISGQPHGCRSFRAGFARTWNSLHGPDAWDANPWVCAVSFTVRHGNIDEGRQG